VQSPRSFDERLFRNFLDILILAKFKEQEKTGYEIVTYFNQNFEFTISPGTVYSLLYSMERQGLIKGEENDKHRIFKLTQKGKDNLEAVIKTSKRIQESFNKLLGQVIKS
jgi:DNA-binding PadR family transcriptional regulator